jgi:predicted DNA-binding protein YlxM (UPF0122 family)
MARQETPEQTASRFWSKVNMTSDDSCWTWKASTRRRGYGGFALDGKTRAAHRVSWMLANGAIPDGMLVCHRCDNPSCVRPNHLFLGSQQENVDDMIGKGRDARGQRHARRVLTEHQVREIHRMLLDGVSWREIAKAFGMSKRAIESIAHNQTWAHLGLPRIANDLKLRAEAARLRRRLAEIEQILGDEHPQRAGSGA